MNQTRSTNPYQQPPVHDYGGLIRPNFRCPYCQSDAGPYAVSKVSTQGWVVVLILLLFCLPLFWIGLFMKEEIYYCRTCRMKLS